MSELSTVELIKAFYSILFYSALSICRLSVRAFTQLFDEDRGEVTATNTAAPPLFTDTFLSLPVVTEAGEPELRSTSSLTQQAPSPFFTCCKVFFLFFSFCPTEPLSGVIEGVSAGMFLIAMVVGVTVLLVCRQKARKV